MKNAILKFLIIGLMTQSYAVSSFAQSVGPLDLDQLQIMVDSGKLSEDQYNDYVDLLESGGETAIIQPPAERVFENQDEANMATDDSVKDVGSVTNIAELQNFSDKQVAGYGNWAFQFVYISKADGSRKVLTARNMNNQVRPASTMKLFTSSLAFDLGTYTNSVNLTKMLQHSVNGMADKALRSTTTASKYSGFTIPSGSYLKSSELLGYRMYDSTEGKSQIIDATIIKGCAIMKDAYKNLEDSSKFHPVNGSGLQSSAKDSDLTENKVTARLETALLERILANKAKYNQYKKYLPTPGGSGTLAARFKQSRSLAKIYAKTGTLGTTKALAGFAETAKGTIVFSVIGDRLKGVSVKQAMSGQIENLIAAHIKYIRAQEAK